MKTFNTTAVCIPTKHYMVDISERITDIKKMVDDGKYFTINRARQYGKTTTLDALAAALEPDYIVINLDFQDISNAAFRTEGAFVQGMCRIICDTATFMDTPIPPKQYREFEELNQEDEDAVKMDELFRIFMRWFKDSEKPIVLMIDEVDSATNNQVFLDFLAQFAKEGELAKNRFVEDGKLNMRLILEGFIDTYTQVCGPLKDRFRDKDGREQFLLYLKPIINGTGNYYIEAQTRDQTRTDVIVDYLGKQYIIELKIWRGERYNADGEKQICEYLDHWKLTTGYMLSFNFNKKKEQGVKRVQIGDKVLFEGTV